MRSLPLLVLVAAVLGVNMAKGSTPRIVGGHTTDITHNPWLVQLVYSRYSGYYGRQWCAGSILDRYTILTAAHCVDQDTNTRRWSISAGTSTKYQRLPLIYLRRAVPVRKITMHPLYNTPSLYDNDIAIIKLSKPLKLDGKYVDDVKLYQGTDHRRLSRMSCKVAGWGTMSKGGTTPTKLREVGVKVTSKEYCSNYLWETADTVLCAGAADISEGGKDSCQEDSGGPLVCQSGGAWYQAGIVSWGRGCGYPNHPGVYTHVGAYYDWIQKNR